MEKAVGASIQVGSEFDDAEWTEFVDSAPDATPAHLIAWRDLIRGVFGYEPAYRVARREGRICGVLPAFVVASALLGRHIISVPFLNYGGICAADDQCRSALIDESRRMLSTYRVRHFEMRCAYPPCGLPAREHKVRIVLDLPGSAGELWTSLRSEIRNRVRRAQREGLAVEFASTDLDGFYRVFSENMRDLGVPAHPRRFFEAALGLSNAVPSVHCSLFPIPYAQLVTIKAGRQTIGGAILIAFRDTVEAPWISCSRSHFEKCPNNLLYWEILRRACDDGFRLFDFGRSSPNTGPAVFKMRWGARAEQLYWHYALPEGAVLPGETGSANPRFRLASALWRRTPRAMTNLLGPRLIAHLPG